MRGSTPHVNAQKTRKSTARRRRFPVRPAALSRWTGDPSGRGRTLGRGRRVRFRTGIRLHGHGQSGRGRGRRDHRVWRGIRFHAAGARRGRHAGTVGGRRAWRATVLAACRPSRGKRQGRQYQQPLHNSELQYKTLGEGWGHATLHRAARRATVGALTFFNEVQNGLVQVEKMLHFT